MKTMISSLLGTAALLAGAAGASAADLPMAKAESIEYVQYCSDHGTGFYVLPGTDTCLKISGYVRGETRYTEQGRRNGNTISFFTRGNIVFDARTNTEIGLVRSLFSIRGENTSGTSTAPSSTSFFVDRAFIEFAGITAGRFYSFFENPTGGLYGNLRFFDDPLSTTASTYNDGIAYTAKFGGGFSATLSLEDGTTRRGVNTSAAVIPNLNAGRPSDYGGQTIPDVIGALKYTAGWGQIRLSGALHQLRPLDPLVDTKYGYAVELGSEFKLDDYLTKGSKISFISNYTDGAPQYANVAGRTTTFGVPVDVADAAIVGTDLKLTKTYGSGVSLTYYWVPSVWRSTLQAIYLKVDQNSALTKTGNFRDFTQEAVGFNTIYTPVKNLDIGAEIIYSRLDYKGRISSANRTYGENDAFSGRIRIQRNF